MNELTVNNFETLKSELNKELLSTAQSVCRIGYLLKLARDTEILAGSSYSDVYDFATAEFGLDKSQVSRFMRINDRFSIEGNSEQLLPEYAEYGSSKLSLMLTLPDEINQELSPEYSKSDIQTIKEEYEEEQKISDLEVMMEEKPEDEPDEFIALVTKQLNDEHTEPMRAIHFGVTHGIEIDEDDVKDAYMPAGDCTYNIRIAGQGRFMINCKDKEISIVNMRDPENKTTLSWPEFMKAALEDEKTREFKEEPEKSEKPKDKPKPKKVEKSKAKPEPKKEEPKKEEIMPEPEEPEEEATEEQQAETDAAVPIANPKVTAFERHICSELGALITEISSPLKTNWGYVTDKLRDTIRKINNEPFKEV